MAVPKQRQNSSRTRRRRNHNLKKETPVQTVTCSACDAQMLPHRMCDACGVYRGRVHKTAVTKA